MKICAAILAAGRGARFGADKVEATLGDKAVWRWSLDAYLSHPEIDSVILVTASKKVKKTQAMVDQRVRVIAGGESRQQSSKIATLAAVDADILLIHDGARPFVTHDLISRTIQAVKRSHAAAAATKVVDSIREKTPDGVRMLDRNNLLAMQTPQGATRDLLLKAHEAAKREYTDEMALVEAMNVQPEFVEGEINNFKITNPEDLMRARLLIGTPETRTGIGYDIHPFSTDPSRTLFLGGIAFPNHLALDGHSDADVLLHAACDALLGAASLGDIGEHFPNTDLRWKNCPSTVFLNQSAKLVCIEGWTIVNLDMTLIAETPKIMKRASEIRSIIATSINIDVSRVSVKATTNEKLGSIGRGEGIAAFAIATLTQTFWADQN